MAAQESGVDRAKKWLATLWVGIAVRASGAVIGYLLTNQVFDQDPLIGGLVGILAAAVGFPLLFVAAACPMAWRLQRNEARAVIESQRGSEPHRIEPVEARSDPAALIPIERILRLVIQNEGRGGIFAVTLLDIAGSDNTFVDSHVPLYWQGRYGTIDEEIPKGDGRSIGVGVIVTRDPGFAFLPLNKDGEKYARSYTLPTGTMVVSVRVSLRRETVVSYSKDMDISLRWDGPGKEVFIGLV